MLCPADLFHLSPIMEQSPADDKLSPAQCAAGAQGTIVGEALAAAQQSQSHSHSRANSISAHPLAALSFPDHTVAPTEDISKVASAAPKASWTIYQSPEKTLPDASKPAVQSVPPLLEADVPMALEQVSAVRSFLSKSSFHAPHTEDLFPASQDLFHRSHCDVPMSPEPAPRPVVDVAMSPAPASRSILDFPMSPEQAAPKMDWFTTLSSPVAKEQPDLDFTMGSSSPQVGLSSRPQVGLSTSMAGSRLEAPMPLSPARGPDMCLDVPMSPAQAPALSAMPKGTPLLQSTT